MSIIQRISYPSTVTVRHSDWGEAACAWRNTFRGGGSIIDGGGDGDVMEAGRFLGANTSAR